MQQMGSPISFLEVRTPQVTQRVPRRGAWLPFAAMTASLLLAAAAGLLFGTLAATQTSIARDRWLPTVQAHADIQLWGWFAVFIVTLVFEFIVRLNRAPAIAPTPRAATFLLLGGGAAISATGRVLDPAMQPLVLSGAVLTALGAALFAVLVFRVPPARPYREDLHPLFFRLGAAWLMIAAIASTLAAARGAGGVAQQDDLAVAIETLLRGFVLNIVIAVGLRAFPGHLGIPPVAVTRQRVIGVLANGGLIVWLVGAGGLGRAGFDLVRHAGDLLFALSLAWATVVFPVFRAVVPGRTRPDRAQALVATAWLGLVVYAAVLTGQTALALARGEDPQVLAGGATRHIYMLGFVAPLLIAMGHVVMERFGTGRLRAANWLTTSFILLAIAWPLRVLPPLLGDGTGALAHSVMGTAGLLATVALVIAAGVSARNGWLAAEEERLFRRPG